jgi:Concanavalin A-like lectin/glucanases superfamily/Putative Ig domain
VIPLNEWTHLAITFDGLKKRLYVNGRQEGSHDELDALVYEADVPVTIGSDWANKASSARFNGRIDEISLYNRALTADEVISIYNADFVGKDLSQPYFTSPAQLPDAVLGASYAQQVLAILGTGPVSFSLPTGGFPPGMTLSSAGLVSGVPNASGTFGFTARATDAAGAFTDQTCLLQVFASVTAPAGLVGWWRAENNAQDSAGTNHGLLRNGAGFVAGRVDQAFALDGTDDCIEIPDAPALRPLSVTLEAWVAFDVTSGRQVILAKPRDAGPINSYALWLEVGILSGAARDGALAVPFSPVPGRWHHLAYTLDDVNKQQALYVDGIPVASGRATSPIAYGAQPLLLGCDTQNGAPKSFLHGRIDEAAIYNRALSGAEIASIFNAGAAGKRL